MEKQNGAKSRKIRDSSRCNAKITLDKNVEADYAAWEKNDGKISWVRVINRG